MPRFDLTEPELRVYAPQVREPGDFDAFWERTVAEAREASVGVRVEPVATGLRAIDAYDLTFPGFGGDPVKAWYLRPAGDATRLSTVVEFIGYGGGRGLPHEHLAWAASGRAYVLMDTRGQGSSHGSGGGTADPHGAGPSSPGFMTRGIEDPEAYYYRRVFTDAVRCVDAVRALDGVDPDRISVSGGSQGGGIALAVGGLHADVAASLVDVPFLCHFERAVGMTDRDPYHEIVRYLSVHRDRVDTVFDTLSYFDGVSFARRSSAPALFSAGLLDTICPPSTVFAAFNTHAAAHKEIDVYPYNKPRGRRGLPLARAGGVPGGARALSPQTSHRGVTPGRDPRARRGTRHPAAPAAPPASRPSR